MSVPGRRLRTDHFTLTCTSHGQDWEETVLAVTEVDDGLGWNLMVRDGSDGGIITTLSVIPATPEDRAEWEQLLYVPV